MPSKVHTRGEGLWRLICFSGGTQHAASTIAIAWMSSVCICMSNVKCLHLQCQAQQVLLAADESHQIEAQSPHCECMHLHHQQEACLYAIQEKRYQKMQTVFIFFFCASFKGNNFEISIFTFFVFYMNKYQKEY